MKDINGYNIPSNIIDAIKIYIKERPSSLSGGISPSDVVITSINHDDENYHVEFINHLFSSVTIPKHEINKIARDNKINQIIN